MCDHGDSQDLFQPAVFEITETVGLDGAAHLLLVGELDLASCGRLSARLQELAASRARVLLDISGLTFIDSSGVAVLIHYARDARRGGWTLQIGRDGLHRQVRRVIELVGVDQTLWASDKPNRVSEPSSPE